MGVSDQMDLAETGAIVSNLQCPRFQWQNFRIPLCFVAYMLCFVTASEAKQSPSLQEDCFNAFGVSQ
jgi:hypothetical protein